MRTGLEDGQRDESRLVRLYMDLTGATESQARNVFAHVCEAEPEEKAADKIQTDALPTNERP